MKSSMKFALSLLLGSSVLVLTACDNQETKTTEKSTALSANAQDQHSKTVEAEKAAKSTTADNTDKSKANTSVAENDMTEKTDIESKAVSDVAKTEKSVVIENETKKKIKKAIKVSRENTYLGEQKALLKVLESQYAQVRCSPEAAKLGDYSFCRQEERRLSEEIKRVIDEIRLNQ
ncbi:hypothetical protein [Rodentibacter haemolyticus]|uniref:Lipoprotein n=1 Tax=Rodentibacter haemolyticus TaxID=2778911 RepID=A0ABX6UYN8_9PAST|nr:hypothetical protein [Rodentibacter haemolyticus]QPB43093.1 hypothetical protein IHV77_02975 [Rodentibacter haemolyticus]